MNEYELIPTKNNKEIEKNGNKFFNNLLAGAAFSLTLLTTQLSAIGIVGNAYEVKPYITNDGIIKNKIENNTINFDPKTSLNKFAKDQSNISINVAFIEKILEDVQKFEKEYDISKIDFPNVKNLEGQINTILNSNLKNLVDDYYLTYSKLYLENINIDKNKIIETPDGKMDINDIMSNAEEEISYLISKYNEKVINTNDTAVDVAYGYTEETHGQEDYTGYVPDKNKVDKIKLLIVENDFNRTLENLVNNSEELKLFTPKEIEKLTTYLDLDSNFDTIKNLPNIEQSKVDFLEDEIKQLKNEINDDLTKEFKNIYNIDLDKEIYNNNFDFKER